MNGSENLAFRQPFFLFVCQSFFDCAKSSFFAENLSDQGKKIVENFIVCRNFLDQVNFFVENFLGCRKFHWLWKILLIMENFLYWSFYVKNTNSKKYRIILIHLFYWNQFLQKRSIITLPLQYAKIHLKILCIGFFIQIFFLKINYRSSYFYPY